MEQAAWTDVPAAGTAQFLQKCAKNPGRWFYPCSANHRDPRRCTFEFLQSSVPVHVRVEECAYTEGGTGWRVWPCALLLAGWLVGQARELQVQGCRVLELGCGLGLPALTAAVLGAESVASDCLPVLLRTVERSACANDAPRRARVALLDWDDESSCAMTGEEYSTEQGVKAAQLAAETQGSAGEGAEAGAEAGAGATACARLAASERFDLLLASDVIYSVDHARQLPEVLAVSRASMPAASCMRHAHRTCTAYTLHTHFTHTAHIHRAGARRPRGPGRPAVRDGARALRGAHAPLPRRPRLQGRAPARRAGRQRVGGAGGEPASRRGRGCDAIGFGPVAARRRWLGRPPSRRDTRDRGGRAVCAG